MKVKVADGNALIPILYPELISATRKATPLFELLGIKRPWWDNYLDLTPVPKTSRLMLWWIRIKDKIGTIPYLRIRDGRDDYNNEWD